MPKGNVKTRPGLAQASQPEDDRDALRRQKTAAFIERMLAERGINQKKLAEAAELDTSFLGLVRKGLRGFEIESSNKLAHALGLPEWYVARECGLIADAPVAEDTPAVPANPLKATLFREIDEEDDTELLVRLLEMYRVMRQWDEPGRAVAEKKTEKQRSFPIAA
jgi:transcriptional regulator with XRE-family HTH domain